MENGIKIGNVQVKNKFFLAPMAGYTDVGFRYLAKKYGAGLTYSELVSAKALVMGSKKTENLLLSLPSEKPFVVQLFGNDPDVFAKAVKLDCLKKADIIDINMGCPAPKIVKNGEGSALLNDINRARNIIKACVSNTDKPITIKFRSGFSDDDIVAVEFAKMCEEAGASAICLHPRTTEQGFSGKADWSLFEKIRKVVRIPIIASGDVRTKADADFLFDTYGVDAVMIGRAALGNPHIFESLLSKNFDTSEALYTIQCKIADIKTQIEILRNYFSDTYVCNCLKSSIAFYLGGGKKLAKQKMAIMTSRSLGEMLIALESILSDN